MRHAARALAAALILAIVGLPSATLSDAAATPADGPPNIVMIYIDDVAPHDGRLWNNRDLTPTLHDLFVDEGTYFPNAIAENPVCCPARGNLLTGLHTHNNAVNSNHGRKFNPQMHIGKGMGDAGYSSMFIGKYLNRVNIFSAAEWQAHAAGWSHFDVTKGANGQFYDYTLFTKQGDITYTNYHATQMIADRFVMRSREEPADKPLFAILSIYNLHAPNTPLPQFIGDERCASMPPWNPPNYNVIGDFKPSSHYARTPVPYPDGWPMVKFCEEMLGVDWLTAQVVDELAAQGRLGNTLLVFTADNGMGWGAHRIGQSKRQPFTTPVPLYMSWPARWGSEGRTVTEHTSNIDLAPTFCELGGCTLGPFPHGQQGPDGVSLMPLLDGDVAHLGRDAILAQHVDPAFNPQWHALRTTEQHPAGLWHYVEWTNGDIELYDAVNDPWELTNLASSPDLAELRAQLSARLAQLKVAGTVNQVGPSVPQDLIAGAHDNYVINLSWQASISHVPGTMSYRVFRDGAAIGSRQSALTFTDQRNEPSAHDYQVRAIDAQGNKSELSPLVTVTAVKQVDGGAPPLLIGPSVPTGLAATAHDNFVISLSWQASTSSAAGPIRYRVFRNGKAIGSKQLALTLTDQRKKANNFSYQVRAIDAAGNNSPLSSPVTISSVRSAGSSVTSGPTIPASLAATANDNFLLRLSWQASTSDVGGTIRYRVFRNGKAIGSLQTALELLDQRKQANTFNYQVRAIDAAGNKSALSAPVTISSVQNASGP